VARRRMAVADVKEILVHWDAGQGVSAIARALGYSRPTVRKYVRAGRQAGLVRGGQRRRQAGWEQLGIQALGAAAIIGWTVVTAAAAFLLLKYTIGLRVRAEEEVRGLDLDEHGIEAYPYFERAPEAGTVVFAPPPAARPLPGAAGAPGTAG
jgi:hypothetical protein